MAYQHNSNESDTSTNDLHQRMMNYLIRTEQTTQPEPFTYTLHKAPFGAQAYEAEEEIDQHLDDLSQLESVSTPSPRLVPQPSTNWGEARSRVICGNSGSGEQSTFGHFSGWQERGDHTQYSIVVPIMTDQGIAYQAAEEECDACCSYFSSQNSQQMTGSFYRPPSHSRDSQWDIASNPVNNGRHRLEGSSVGLQYTREQTNCLGEPKGFQKNPSLSPDKRYAGGV
ncbi:hypothetical protein C366_06449 [Cryptococcus neoformans Tu401-1]|nr:hypothetical protein C365_06505 [Cryptococcus neoformans var. grubii Bt85]OXG10946.1 hypothetical protein C366_06449 [Cryptococcus neoformans var. grubii Tu401-1]OXM75884.1 hypothetical protein C364_06434 [Cryptococcus neoformans var. grubii Bt63]